ncbi:hypothetical protein IW140_006601, partial [Coemansia sp. RSA 1813]
MSTTQGGQGNSQGGQGKKFAEGHQPEKPGQGNQGNNKRKGMQVTQEQANAIGAEARLARQRDS